MSQSRPPITRLSLRQRQILELIRQGKSNHEIAFELGIGVGTVKQHVVALFRKLKVTSRTMAASRKPQGSPFGCDHALGSSKDVILERRPCIVLSMVLERPEPEALRRLHGNMARVAQDAGDIVLSRRGVGCDIIFGIEQAEESVPVRVLRCVQAIARTHADQERPGGILKGALAAGLAVASMFRRGGWSGEAIASSSIVLARHRTNESEPGRLFLDQTFTDLLSVCDAAVTLPPPCLPLLEEAPALNWHPAAEIGPIISRKDECRAVLGSLDSSLRDQPIIGLWGEAGVGKSWLCAKLTRLLLERERVVTRIKCLPADAPAAFFRIDDRSLCDSVAQLLDGGRGAPPAGTSKARKPGSRSSTDRPLLILDNAHWLSRETRQVLFGQALQRGYRILSVSRGPEEPDSSIMHHVQPIEDSRIERFVSTSFTPLAHNPALARKAAQTLTSMARGNPFFIREMLRSMPLLSSHLADEHPTRLPLSIVLRVTALFDALHLDKRLLRFVGHSPQGMTVKDLALAMGEEEDYLRKAVEDASAASILGVTNSGRVLFNHPMHHCVTHYLGMDI